MAMIRQAQPEDIHEVCELAYSVFGWVVREEKKRIKKFFEDLLLECEENLKRKDWRLFVAVDKGVIVGTALLQRVERSIGWVRLVAVKENYRRKGIGTELIKHILRKAKEMGMTRLFLLTPAKNVGAQIFYIKLGFTPIAHINGISETDDDWFDTILFEKRLVD